MASAATNCLDTSYFFQRLASSEKRYLVLDFDTTLARIENLRAPRFPLPVIGDLLEMIVAIARTRLVLATSAPSRELALSLMCPGLEIWGEDSPKPVLTPSCVGGVTRAPLEAHVHTNGDRHTLMRQKSTRYPLAYLAGAAMPQPKGELLVTPELHLDNSQVLTGTPESLVQFLAEWLRVCAGEVC